jgi:hypothetical protein
MKLQIRRGDNVETHELATGAEVRLVFDVAFDPARFHSLVDNTQTVVISGPEPVTVELDGFQPPAPPAQPRPPKRVASSPLEFFAGTKGAELLADSVAPDARKPFFVEVPDHSEPEPAPKRKRVKT